MDNTSCVAQISWPPTFYKDSDIPFASHGKEAWVEGSVEEVIGLEGLIYARKSLLINNDEQRDSVKQRLVQEARILRLCRHTHVVRFVDAYFSCRQEKLRFSIVMDRADTSLESYVALGNLPGKVPELAWFGCLIAVVRYIHRSGIRHRDIKPTNILVKDNRILLADFGISQMGLGETIPTTVLGRKSLRTKAYCAPEVDEGRTRGRSADIFSLGAVFLEMWVACASPMDRQPLRDILKHGDTLSYAKNVDRVLVWMKQKASSLDAATWQFEILGLCQAMLSADRTLRPPSQALELRLLPMCKCPRSLPMTEADELIEACAQGTAEDVRRTLDTGADANTPGAIHLASARGSTSIIQVLLDAKADIDLPNPAGQTALHCAARNGSASVVELLLQSSANVNARDDNKQTALHGAAVHGHVGIAQMLIDAGADKDAEDVEGDTPYHFAGRSGRTAVLEMLATD